MKTFRQGESEIDVVAHLCRQPDGESIVDTLVLIGIRGDEAVGRQLFDDLSAKNIGKTKMEYDAQ